MTQPRSPARRAVSSAWCASSNTRTRGGVRRGASGATPGAPAFESKICSPQDVVDRAATLPRPLVFTNGVFDILHRGHVTYLAQARALGASLIVAVNAD